MTRLVLLPSPLGTSATWGRLPKALAELSTDSHLIEPQGDQRAPFAARWVASCAKQIALLPAGSVVLVAHSGAGPLLAQVGFALRAAHRPIGAYAFVDAGLPRQQPGSRLEAFTSEHPSFAADMTAELESGGSVPQWEPQDLGEVPDAKDRETIVAALRPRGLEFWTEALPTSQDWPDAPCVYLRTSALYDRSLKAARARGWPTAALDVGHFPGFTDPVATATALLDLLRPVTT